MLPVRLHACCRWGGAQRPVPPRRAQMAQGPTPGASWVQIVTLMKELLGQLCCCRRCYKAVNHQIFQCMLWKSGFSHTSGPWERALLCLTQASSGRHECNILPVCFIQRAYFLLPFKAKCYFLSDSSCPWLFCFSVGRWKAFHAPSLQSFAFFLLILQY